MKKTCLIVIILLAVALPAVAGTTLLNLGYNVQLYREYDYSRRGIGIGFTFLAGETSGFYAQIVPFIVTSTKSGGSVYRLVLPDVVASGLNFTLGFGGDINFGSMGFIVGGGFFGTTFSWVRPLDDYIYYETAAGVGGGAHLYYQPDSGPFILNAGLDVAWRPFEIAGSTTGGFYGFSFEKSEFNFNINAGIGFRH